MKFIISFFVVIFVTVLLSDLVKGHGRLLQPAQRSSVWRDPTFNPFNPTPNYNDDALWCGYTPQDYVPDSCGPCGDGLNEPRPRPNENGGQYGKSIITGNYTRGQTIPINFELTASHNGYLGVQICDDVGQESEACFQRRGFLRLNGGTTDRIDVTGRNGPVAFTATLPADLSCNRCVLRLYYRTAKEYSNCDGICECTPPGNHGCGKQETILNCADVSISL